MLRHLECRARGRGLRQEQCGRLTIETCGRRQKLNRRKAAARERRHLAGSVGSVYAHS